MRGLRRLAALALTAALALGVLGLPALAAEPETFTLGIYSTTDMHGKCYGLNPITGGEVKDSFLKVASAMAQERAAMDGVILVDNGDTIQGTPITSYNVNVEGGKDNPMALCLRYIGYDAFVLGNHEFNYTMEVQDIFYNMLKDESDQYPGSPVDVICANYIDIATQKPVQDPYAIRTFTVGGREFKVGILGMENVNVPNWDLPSHYEGADFVHQDNAGRTYAYEWTNYWQAQLREVEQCDFVVVSVHSGEGAGLVGDGADGAVQTGAADGFDPENQARHLIENTTGIDLVISGHNHQSGAYEFQNADGDPVPCVNGGTSSLTKTVVTIAADGSFTVGDSENLKLADYENDPGLEAITTPYYDKTVPFVSEQIGLLSGQWDDVTDYHLTQGDTYDLVQKAQLWASGADVSITTPVPQKGFALSQLFEEGKDAAVVSLKDCYAFYKYDNNLLYMIELTGKQLKDWLEVCAKTYKIEDGKLAGGGFGCDIAYGVDYDVYVGNPEGSRVQNVMYKGVPLADDEILKVALSSYRLSANELGDEYGWYAATGITMGSDKVLWDASVSEQFGGVGGSVPLIIGEYIKEMSGSGKDITPGRDTWFHVYAAASGAETPAGPMTRLEFVEAMYAAAGSPTVAPGSVFHDFSDLTGNAALNWASLNRIVTGDGNGSFLPDEPITREQAAIMLLNTATALGKGPEGAWATRIPYSDAASISPWATDGVMWNVISELIPVTDNAFHPSGAVTAAEAEAMIAALLAL